MLAEVCKADSQWHDMNFIECRVIHLQRKLKSGMAVSEPPPLLSGVPLPASKALSVGL